MANKDKEKDAVETAEEIAAANEVVEEETQTEE